MTRLVRIAALLAVLFIGPRSAPAGLLSLTLVSGATDLLGGTEIGDPTSQESLSGSTLGQLGAPLLFDPKFDAMTSLTVRIANVSAADVLFPEFLPGVSVLSGVNGIPGYTSKVNVGAGGAAGKSGAMGTEGAISRLVLDTTYDLQVAGSPATISHGGGGGAGTGVAESWIALRGASGAELSEFLSGRTLHPGEWIDVPGFAWITDFHRAFEGERLAFGLDLPTFSSGGISVTTSAWTGSFAEAAPASPPPPPVISAPTVPEPETSSLILCGLALGAARRGFLRSRRERGQDRAGE